LEWCLFFIYPLENIDKVNLYFEEGKVECRFAKTKTGADVQTKNEDDARRRLFVVPDFS